MTAAERDAQDHLTAIARTARAFSSTTTNQADANDGRMTHDRDASPTGPSYQYVREPPDPVAPRDLRAAMTCEQ